MHLATGIRCVQRSPETLPRTLKSLKDAGFSDAPYLFVDGEFAEVESLAQHGTVVHRLGGTGVIP